MSRWILFLVLGALQGCKQGSESTSAAPEPPKGTTPVQIAALPGSPPAAVPAARPGVGGRSAVPTLDEWGSVGEVTVKGSSALGCETKMVREWVRISCRGKNNTGGTARSVTVDRGDRNRGDVFKFVSGSVVSLVYPFVAGTDFAATFTWSNGRHQLVSRWPHGAPQPSVVGEMN